jgi:flagellar motor switch protein FliG
VKAAGAPQGAKKAAILLVLLGEEAAASIYPQLQEHEIEKLTAEIADMGPVPAETGLSILEEYSELSRAGEGMAQGGAALARRLLVTAFGEDGAKHLLDELSQAAEQSNAKLDSLRKVAPAQLARFLEAEHPQTVALILAHLEAKQASTVLLGLPEEMRGETVHRLALLRQFSPEVARRVSLALNKRLQAIGEQSRRAYEGLKGVADVLNRLEPAAAKSILERIEKEDPKLAIGVRNLMFTFEDLLTVTDVGIREILAQLDKKLLGTALRGASEPMKAHIFKAMSARAVDMMKEDMEAMGPVRGREITKAQMEVVEVARRLEAEGRVQLGPEQEDEYIA